MHQNNIEYIQNGYFEDCIELNVLSVSYNIMTSVPNFSGVSHTITDIYMDYNKISSTESLHDTYFPFLRSLYVGHNHISVMAWSFLDNMPALYFISLENNYLMHIPDIRVMLSDRFLQPLNMHLKGNHWNCAANMVWIWDGVDHMEYFSFDINNTTLRLFDTFRMRCYSPNHTRGLSFWDLSKYKTHIYTYQYNKS